MTADVEMRIRRKPKRPCFVLLLFISFCYLARYTLGVMVSQVFARGSGGMNLIRERAISLGKWMASAALVLLIAGGVRLARSQEIKYSADPNAEKRMTLLLKDYAPHPMVHLAVHEVPRAKFAVIDVHNHVNDAGGVHGEEVPAADVVKIMDHANVKKVVI